MRFLFPLVLIFILSCNSNVEDETIKSKDLFSFLVNNNIEYTNKIIIILPNIGCGGCLSTAEQILEEYSNLISNDKYIIILTDIKDYKKFKLHFKGYQFLTKPNVIIDKNNKLPFKSFYPEVLIVQNRIIVKRHFQKPDSDFSFEKFILKNHQ